VQGPNTDRATVWAKDARGGAGGGAPEGEWCEYHGRLWERHRAAGYCMTWFPDRSWCSRPAAKWQSKQRCNECLEGEISEAAAAKAIAEQEAERQRQYAEEQKRQQEDHRVLEAQPWFPALLRYLDQQRLHERHGMEEWIENYVADKGDSNSCS